jgi:ribosomal protein L37AE/L43A
MLILLTGFSQGLARPKTENTESTAMHTRQPMMSKHACPCCSYTLLRHLRLGGLYWRCSHCYQEMPVL